MLDEPESVSCRQVSKISGRARQQIVDRDDGVSLAKQTIAHMRADKSSGSGNNNSQSIS
jgi:hypothetical protein